MKKIILMLVCIMPALSGCNKISRFIENKMYDTFKKKAAADVRETTAPSKEKSEEEASCH